MANASTCGIGVQRKNKIASLDVDLHVAVNPVKS